MKDVQVLVGIRRGGGIPLANFSSEIGGVRRGMQRVHRDIDAILNEIIEEHQAKGFKGDGTDTSSATLEWAMTELVRKPMSCKRLKQRIQQTYLYDVITETLSVHPAVLLLVPRLCRETVEIGGYTVPVGSRVVVNAWAIMREARWWEHQERFMPESFEKLEALDSGGVATFDQIPFGGGRRICP
ncbi:hypothetical protein HPP92_013107 [Vanilla planifolia]|uniref:Cytochrome P450 n=1 Tax=Vanilla planifolia TaxID=51239 RepID=A0A835UYH3_VANPL|nr:hypothetical protein HPP92_013107 [Vanilla planifolia]